MICSDKIHSIPEETSPDSYLFDFLMWTYRIYLHQPEKV